MTETAPVAWQIINGERIPVKVSFNLINTPDHNLQKIKYNSIVGFSLGNYNPAYSLIIDPTLQWNTFIGSSNLDDANGVSVDSSGNIYVCGASQATWGTPINSYAGGSRDFFVAKFNSSGVLQWNTFLGSAYWDAGGDIVVDGSGNVYVYGHSDATWGTPVSDYAGKTDTFVAKLNSSGVLQWNTFLGSTDDDYQNAITVDNNGNIYVSGDSNATWGSPLNSFSSGYSHKFVAKLNNNGALQWNTFLESVSSLVSGDITVDISGNIYVSGTSNETWGSPINSFSGEYSNPFVAKLNSSGTLQWNTFLGSGSHGDTILDNNNLYVIGVSDATWGTPVKAFSGDLQDVFIAKLNSNGTLQWNTFLGSVDLNYMSLIACGVMDNYENIYFSGYTSYTWGMPVNPYSGDTDTFVAKVNSSGVLQWNTFWGSTDSDFGLGIALDGNGYLYSVGTSNATWGSPVASYTGSSDGFLAKLATILDADDDEMDDSWENSYFGNTLRNGTGDYDSDGLNDLQEYQNNTNPTDSDTDDDTLNDGDEVNTYETDPSNSDTDDDGMADGWEVQYDLNPLVDDANLDTDGDGFKNIVEYNRNTEPNNSNSHPPNSMPWLLLLLETSDQTSQITWYKDSDGDGYSDGTIQIAAERPGEEYYMESELTAISGDLDDNDSTVYPQATEICGDDKDNNQDGEVDEGCDSEGGVTSIPKTGQTTCFDSSGNVINCAGTGQDGGIQAGVEWPEPRFEDNGNGTVTDNLTGLIWLKNADCFSQKNWATALTDSNTLANGSCGLTDGSVAGDWRLPNIKELQSLMDYRSYDPVLPTGHPFTSVQSSYYWSSTSKSIGTTSAWSMYMAYGGGTSSAKTNSYYVWPVRSDTSIPKTGQTTCFDSSGNVINCAGTGQDGDIQAGVEWPEPRFEDNGDGTVTDNLTGLIWLKNAGCFSQKNWATALTDSNTLANGSCGLTDGSATGDWRLPNPKELESLIDYSNLKPSLPTGHPFTGVQSQWYWSSTSFINATMAWYVNIGFGNLDHNGKAINAVVWPVRGGN